MSGMQSIHSAAFKSTGTCHKQQQINQDSVISRHLLLPSGLQCTQKRYPVKIYGNLSDLTSNDRFHNVSQELDKDFDRIHFKSFNCFLQFNAAISQTLICLSADAGQITEKISEPPNNFSHDCHFSLLPQCYRKKVEDFFSFHGNNDARHKCTFRGQKAALQVQLK